MVVGAAEEVVRLAAADAETDGVRVRAISRRVLSRAPSAAESERVGWALMKDAVQTIFTSEDAREGREAFLEKRTPQWKGR